MQAYVCTRDWIDTEPPMDRDHALGELARRYLAGHGPADARDLAKWSGLSLRDVRTGLHSIGAAATERADGLTDVTSTRLRRRLPGPRLLGPFDPLLHGWQSRDDIVGTHQAIVTVNGIFRAIALVNGVARGIWSIQPSAVELRTFAPLSDDTVAALEREARDVLRFLGQGPRPLRII